jgi:hypothetical protein
VTPPGDAYWVVPGRLLAGPSPDEETGAFIDFGVTCFLDLTEEGELDTYSKRLPDGVSHLRMPIPDFSVPTVWHMRAVLATIRAALDAGETVFVHCYGGVGRTGTVAGCFLREEGVPADEVIGRLATLRSDTEKSDRTSPESDEQRDFVTGWPPRSQD